MDDDRRRPNSLRLRWHDYSTPAAYFVTMCVEGRACLLGELADGRFEPSIAGLMVESWWGNIERRFPGVVLGPWVVMPNHLHGIVILGGRPEVLVRESENGATPAKSLPGIVGWFKTMTTNDYIRGVEAFGWPPFIRRFWQRGFHDHIIRDEQSFARISEYIENNPATWSADRLRPTVE